MTKDDTWINKTDLLDDFDSLPEAIPNAELRAQVNNYFLAQLPRDKEPSRKEERNAAAATILQFPPLVDYYIRYKEDHGDRAESVSSQRVAFSDRLYVRQLRKLRDLLKQVGFYDAGADSHEASLKRAAFLKDVIENKGGWRLFYVDGKPIQREDDLHVMYRLTWFGTSHDVSREVDDGRGPADFKISRGARDKTIVEFKLGSNSKLRRNLEKQVEVYKKASDAEHGVKVILYFSEQELERVTRILEELGMDRDPNVVLIDAGREGKVSGSRA
jgi:hypothetical protein